MKNQKLLSLSLSIPLLLLAGCGKKADYDAYKEEVNKLYDSIAIANVQLNEIEIYSEESKETFFNTIDNLEKAFEDFSKVEAPEEFEACVQLSTNANIYLNKCEEAFHVALDNEFNEDVFNDAAEEYNEVIKCVNNMGLILQGKEIVIEENETIVDDSEN